MFMFRDVNPSDAGPFASSGMVTEKGKWSPKPSYYYIATLKKRLAGMRFSLALPSTNPDVHIYKFVGAGGRSACVVWAGTSEDRHIPAVTFPVGATTATRIDFEDDSVSGRESAIPVRLGEVRFEAREKPVVILAH
jgi:hypothetical protein